MTTQKQVVRYENGSDVSMRLHDTYLRYEGRPVFARYHDGTQIELFDITPRTQSLGLFDANDPKVDISSAPVGYCNVRDIGPVYLSRQGARRQRQGVTPRSLVGYAEGHRKWYQPVSSGVVIGPPEMASMIAGDYPSVHEIAQDIQKYPFGGAFHRRLAIVPLSGKFKLKLRASLVGIYDPQTHRAKLFKDHVRNFGLITLLDKKGIPVE